MLSLLFWLSIFIVFYAYAGYPAALTALARKWPRPPQTAAITPSVTLLIAAYNEEATIAAKLHNSLSLDYPPDKFQILVTADGSSDRTPAIVEQFASRGVTLLYDPPRRGKMAAINRAMPHATGDIILFSDANNEYAPDTIREMVKPFADPEVGATSGAKHILKGDGALGDSEGLYWKYESYIKQQETLLGSCTGVVGELFAIRRVLFQSPPDSVINDDFYMAMQLIGRGYRVIYVPTAHSSERVSLSAEDEKARRSRIVAGRYQALNLLPWHKPLVVWQIASHKLLRPLVPIAMLVALVANVLVVLFPWRRKRTPWGLGRPFGRFFLFLQTLFYGLALLGNSQPQQGKKEDKLSKILYLPTFLVNSNVAALTGIYRALTKKQSTLWQRAQRRE